MGLIGIRGGKIREYEMEPREESDEERAEKDGCEPGCDCIFCLPGA